MANSVSRRVFLKAAPLVGFSLPVFNVLKTGSQARADQFLLYVGTYTSGRSEGIYLYLFDAATGMLSHSGTTKGVVNPSYLAVDAGRHRLYAVNEVEEFGGTAGGAVTAFTIDPGTGALTRINQQSTGGAHPCYITADRYGLNVLVANYTGGNVAVLPLRDDGGLEKASDLVQHSGSGPDEKRQQGPHAHCIILDPAERLAFAVDLGTDKLLTYDYDYEQGRLTPHASAPFVSLRPGAGPRHITFHPGGAYAYVINELDSTITCMSFDAEKGALTPFQTVSTLPEGFTGSNTCADIHVHPSGRFLYGSNRGQDSIAAFAIDMQTGRLAFIGYQPTGGQTPRNFMIDPTGLFLLAANQNSDTITGFRIDPESGKLDPTGQVTEVPTPVCLKMIPIPS